jgi:hypothetical protein
MLPGGPEGRRQSEVDWQSVLPGVTQPLRRWGRRAAKFAPREA